MNRAILLLVVMGCTSAPRERVVDTSDAAVAPPAETPSCLVFGGLDDRLLSYAGDGGTQWLAGNALRTSSDPCLATDAVSVVTAPSQDTRIRPRSITPDGRWLFYTLERADPGAFFGWRADGFGAVVSVDGGFHPAESLLWTMDRPDFGASSLVENGEVYAWGCAASGFLSSHCFVARAPADRVSDESAWEYYEGGGHWTARVDDAWPIVEAGPQVSVVHDVERGRYLMFYTGVFDGVIHLRVGLAPEGPWSYEIPLTSCRTPPDDPEAFCTNVTAHPAFMSDGGMALSYGLASFTAGADPAERSARFTIVPLPADLP